MICLGERLIASGERDLIIGMPLYDPYQDYLKSEIADVSNCAQKMPYGGAITAALFLKRFVDPKIPWVHIDLMAANLRRPGRPVGGEAQGLRAIVVTVGRWSAHANDGPCPFLKSFCGSL